MKKSPSNYGAYGTTKSAPVQGKVITLEINSDDESLDEAAFTVALVDAHKESRRKKYLVVNVSSDFASVSNGLVMYLITFPHPAKIFF